jgi:hypothetical protein
LHPSWMLNETDVDRRTSKNGTAQSSDELRNSQHTSPRQGDDR